MNGRFYGHTFPDEDDKPKGFDSLKTRDSLNFGYASFQISTVSLPHYSLFLMDICQQIMEFIRYNLLVYGFRGSIISAETKLNSETHLLIF